MATGHGRCVIGRRKGSASGSPIRERVWAVLVHRWWRDNLMRVLCNARFPVVTGLIAVLAVSGDLLLAQPQQITVHGVVTNQSGEPLSGARVTITFVGGGAERSGFTNDAGEYRFQNVERSNGRVEAERSGYRRKGLGMEAGVPDAAELEELEYSIVLAPEPQRIAEGALPVQPVTSEEAAGVEAMLGEGPPWLLWGLGFLMLTMIGAISVMGWLINSSKEETKQLRKDIEADYKTTQTTLIAHQELALKHEGFREVVNEKLDKLDAATGDGRKSDDEQPNRPQQSQSSRSAPPTNPAEDIAKAYQDALEQNETMAFITKHQGTRYGVINASDRARQEKSKQPVPEYAAATNGEYYLIAKGSKWYVVPWFRPIDAHLMDAAALEEIYDCSGYAPNRNQRAMFRRAATIEVHDSHWKVTAKGLIVFDGGA